MVSGEGDAESPAMLLSRLQSILRQFQSSGKTFQLVETGSSPAAAPPQRCRTLIILDSSFNPPTIAHMEMATSALRDLRRQRNSARATTLKSGNTIAANTTEQVAQHNEGGNNNDDNDNDVRLLLLLAVNNADKAPKPASFEQRLLMMQYFAKDIQNAWRQAQEQEENEHQQQNITEVLPVDIGLTTHPYFHEKSEAIAHVPEFISASSSSSTSSIQQIFLAGYDTLIRIFNPKYYTAPATEEGSVPPEHKTQDRTPMQISLDPFLSRARLRVTMRTDADWGGREEQMAYVEDILHGDELEKVGGRREWATRVDMVDAMEAQDGLVVSSTEAREAIESKSWDKVRKLVPESVAGLIEQGEVVW